MGEKYLNYKGNLFLIKNEILEDVKINNKNVVIPNGVKVITKEAFLSGFSVFHRAKHKIEKLWIPSSVKEIEKGTFSECKKLKSVEILSGLTKIEQDLFRDCKNLNKVVLPDSIRFIESGAFVGCTQLKEIQYASYYVKIKNNAFSECEGIKTERVKSWLEHGIQAFYNTEHIEELNFEETLVAEQEIGEQYELYQGNFFWIEKGKLKDVLVKTEKVIIPENVQLIKREAFLRPETKAIVKTLILPASVTKIEYLAFAGLENVEDVEILSRISTIEKGTFRNCIKLKKIALPVSLQRIESRAFENCVQLNEIVFRSEQMVISDDAFLQCSNIKEEKIKSIMVEGYRKFEQEQKEQGMRKGQEFLANLEQVWIKQKQREEQLLQKEKIQKEEKERKERLENINKDTEFCIRNGVLERCEIGSNHIVVPEGVKEIGANAFSFSEKKEDVVCVELPEGVESIGERAFFGLQNLCEIKFPVSVCNFGAEALEGTAWIKKQREQENYVCVNGVLISAFHDSFVMKAELPDTIYRIAPYAFYQNDVRSIVIPNSVRQIDKYAFTEVGVTELVLPNREDIAFCNPILLRCRSLKELTIPEKIEKIDACFVEECLSLTMVYLKSKKTSISKRAFPEYVRFLFGSGREYTSSMISLKWEELG